MERQKIILDCDPGHDAAAAHAVTQSGAAPSIPTRHPAEGFLCRFEAEC